MLQAERAVLPATPTLRMALPGAVSSDPSARISTLLFRKVFYFSGSLYSGDTFTLKLRFSSQFLCVEKRHDTANSRLL